MAMGVMAPFTPLSSQTLSDFEIKLSFVERNDDFDMVRYTSAKINADDSAKQALAAFDKQNSDSRGVVAEATKDGYRIGVFFDNGASARASAIDVMQRCSSLLGDIPATMSYDNPYFKVSVGYCLDKEEAMIMLNRVQRYFPKAYIIRDKITVQNIIESREAEIENERLKVMKAQIEAEKKAAAVN